jgi:hypothetical protein
MRAVFFLFWNQFPHCGYPKRSECEIVQELVGFGILILGKKSPYLDNEFLFIARTKQDSPLKKT